MSNGTGDVRGPNITGTGYLKRSDSGRYGLGGFQTTGAFSPYGDVADGTGTENSGIRNVQSGFELEASRSSGVFGGSTSVQPPSLRVLPCIKA